jgi:hypothetical protein
MLNARGRLCLALLLLPLLAHAPAAYGASVANPGDPPAGSPAGAIYQLPFEKGRADGAPKGSGGTGAGGSGGTEESSYYRTENHFGSSSEVPDDPAGGSGSSAAGGSSGAGGSGSNGGSGGSGGGGGEGSGGGNGGEALASGTNAGEVTDSGNTSLPTNFALLAAILAIGGGVAVISLRGKSLGHPH